MWQNFVEMFLCDLFFEYSEIDLISSFYWMVSFRSIDGMVQKYKSLVFVLDMSYQNFLLIKKKINFIGDFDIDFWLRIFGFDKIRIFQEYGLMDIEIEGRGFFFFKSCKI